MLLKTCPSLFEELRGREVEDIGQKHDVSIHQNVSWVLCRTPTFWTLQKNENYTVVGYKNFILNMDTTSKNPNNTLSTNLSIGGEIFELSEILELNGALQELVDLMEKEKESANPVTFVVPTKIHSFLSLFIALPKKPDS
jgi:hypothetical protein